MKIIEINRNKNQNDYSFPGGRYPLESRVALGHWGARA